MQQKADLFTGIHKAIRGLLYDTGARLQQTNFENSEEREALLNRLDYTIDMLGQHGHHEDELIFPPIEKAAPGSTTEAEQQHHAYHSKLDRLQQLIATARNNVVAGQLARLADELNRCYTDFMAFFLVHMNCEEETTLPASLAHLSNEELLNIRASIQKSMSPDKYNEWLRWMLISMSITELSPMLRQLKASAPPPVVEQVKSLAGRVMEESKWRRLCAEVELA